MTQKACDLDTAIEAVAKQLTQVEHDPHLSARIAASLPERSSWSLGWWAPRLAMIALVVAAGLVWANRGLEVPPPPVVLTGGPAFVPTKFPTEVLPDVPVTVASSNPRQNDRRNDPWNDRRNDRRNDFEHSLPSIPDVAPLELDAIVPASLPQDGLLTVEPLSIEDLPLTAEPDFPR